tara:strand:- start:160 stop:1395 length:1236 start_codon:yes stop_codon:yes gene_type:complete
MATNIDINLISKNDQEIIFDIKGDVDTGLHPSVVNSIRRTLLSDIPTLGFRTQMGNKDIIITKNNTSLHNEFLEQRIALIPLYIDPDTYSKQYLFHLNIVDNNSPEPLMKITSKDFNIYPLKKGIDIEELNKQNDIDVSKYDLESPISYKEKVKIFRPYKYNGEEYFIPITEIKKSSSTIKQELEVWAIPRVSAAYEDASWQAVSCATYSFKKNDELFKKILAEKLLVNEVEEENRDEYIKMLTISESERYFHRDKETNPYWYDFKIESGHFNTPKELFMKACQIIIDQLDALKNEFPKLVSMEEEESIMKLTFKNNIYTLEINQTDDTMGNILQTYISMNLLDESEFEVCGYKNVHPLESITQFNISLKNKIEDKDVQYKVALLIDLFNQACVDLINIYTGIKKIAESNL